MVRGDVRIFFLFCVVDDETLELDALPLFVLWIRMSEPRICEADRVVLLPIVVWIHDL